MVHYRAYLIGHDGRFMKAVDLICDDDDGARKCASKMVDDHNVELWQHDRRIEKFEGRSNAGFYEPTPEQADNVRGRTTTQ
jgi:hypothetical protein